MKTTQVINDVPYGDLFCVEVWDIQQVYDFKKRIRNNFYFLCFTGLWDVVPDSNKGCTLQVYVNVSFSKDTALKGLLGYLVHLFLFLCVSVKFIFNIKYLPFYLLYMSLGSLRWSENSINIKLIIFSVYLNLLSCSVIGGYTISREYCDCYSWRVLRYFWSLYRTRIFLSSLITLISLKLCSQEILLILPIIIVLLKSPI